MRLVGTAASGLRAQQIAIDIIGNNLANANTLGFKANQMIFAEALSTEVRSRNTKTEDNVAVTVDVGAGVLYSASGTDLQQGLLNHTDRSLDLGIDGVGYFQVQTVDGEMGYTRAGAFEMDEAGRLVDMRGNIVQTINGLIPAGAKDVAVAENGDITGVIGEESMVFGQIVLAGFQRPEGLQRNEDNLFVPTDNSGAAQIGQPGSLVGNQVLGTIRGQSLEQSNVDLATSMTDLIQVQRAYQVNSRLVQDGDKMWGLANSMRR